MTYKNEIIKKAAYFIMPVTGVLFLLLYINMAGADTVYSDYIRIVAEYLPDVGDIKKLLVPDILTRIPATFLGRYINVTNFGYSVTFDRILSIAGIGMMSIVLAIYFKKYNISFKWQTIIYIVLFSLNKWEILLNGTAWAHVVSFGFFFVNYYMADRVWRGEADAKEELFLCLMPLFLLMVAGEYIASYCITMILISVLGILMGGVNSWAVKRGQSMFKAVLIVTAAALLLYMLSRHFAVWEHSGAADMSIGELISSRPWFIPRFFLKTFAGAVIGQETIADFFGQGRALPDIIVLSVGTAVLAGYVLAFVLYIRCELFEETIFPAALLISGFGNHMLVTMARWIFVKESYALSSRYAGQFMIGIIGMLIIFAMYGRKKRALRSFGRSEKDAIRICVAAAAGLIIAGSAYTTAQEIRKAPYRRANYVHMGEVILNYENYTGDELKKELEWTKDPEILYKALEILKDNRLNVFNTSGKQ